MLRQIRKQTGLTQREFGELVGLTEGSYRQAEAGRMPISKGLAQRIAHETGCGLEYPSKGVRLRVDEYGKLRREDPIGIRATCGQSDEPFSRAWYDRTRRQREQDARVDKVVDKFRSLVKCAVDAAWLEYDDEKDADLRRLEGFLTDLNTSLFEVMNKHCLGEDSLGASVYNDSELWAGTGIKPSDPATKAREIMLNEIKAACLTLD